MELRGRIKGETDARIFTAFKSILEDYCYDLPEAYLFLEILKLSLEDKYRVVKSQIERHRVIKIKEAEEWRECAVYFIDNGYFDMYSHLAGLSPNYVRKLVKKIDRYFLIKKVQENISLRKKLNPGPQKRVLKKKK